MSWAWSTSNAFVGAPPKITTASLPGATVGTPYSATVAVSGGRAPLQIMITSASPNAASWLPVGVPLVGGVISGTPGTAETDSVQLQVIDAAGLSDHVSLPLVVAPAASGFDFYIGPSGSDSNPGTQASPWAITAINTKRATYAGKRLGVLPGTYNVIAALGGSTANSFSSPVLDVAPGSSGSPTVVQSTVPLGAILDGGLTDANAPNRPPLLGHVQGGDGYYIIDGFEVRNTNDRLISVGGGTGAGSAANCFGVVVQNCYAHRITSTSTGANSTGITAYALNGGLIQNNFVTKVNNSTARNSGIETWSCQNTTVTGNTVIMDMAGASAIYVKNAGQKNLTISYNYIDLSAASSYGGSGALAWDLQGAATDASSVHHNVIVVGSTTSWCFATGIAGVPAGSAAEKQIFYSNTFVCAGGGMRGVQSLGSGAVSTQYDNIYVGVFNPYAFQCGTGGFVASDFNLYQTVGVVAGATSSGSGGTTYNSLAALHGAGLDNNSITGIALFVGGSPTLPANAYQLQSGSPGKGAGSTTGLVGGAATDMGAWGNGATQVGCNFAAAANV